MEEIKLKALLKAIEEKKGEDIVYIDVKDKTPFCSYYILVSVSSSRKAEAIITGVEDVLEDLKQTVRHIEGDSSSDWVLIDCDDIVIHVFTYEERSRVNLESLLKSSTQVRLGEEK